MSARMVLLGATILSAVGALRVGPSPAQLSPQAAVSRRSMLAGIASAALVAPIQFASVR